MMACLTQRIPKKFFREQKNSVQVLVGGMYSIFNVFELKKYVKSIMKPIFSICVKTAANIKVFKCQKKKWNSLNSKYKRYKV